jgi:hypothetical protein
VPHAPICARTLPAVTGETPINNSANDDTGNIGADSSVHDSSIGSSVHDSGMGSSAYDSNIPE